MVLVGKMNDVYDESNPDSEDLERFKNEDGGKMYDVHRIGCGPQKPIPYEYIVDAWECQ